jgi:two-component system phosphate regulon sensor histidine kinase PhoR
MRAEPVLRSRFFWQLYGGYAAVVVLFAVIVGVTVSGWVAEHSREDMQTSLHSKVSLLKELSRDVLGGGRDAQFLKRIQRLGAEIDTRLTVIARDGVVLADSEEDPARMNNHANREELRIAANQGLGFSTRYSNTVEREMMYLAMPVEHAVNGEVVRLGFVRASLSLSVIDEHLFRVRSLVLFGAGIAALVALLLGLFFARRVTSRIEAITAVAEAMAGGDYSRRVFMHSQDEIGKLATAYNSMAQQMQDRVDTITNDRNKVQAILRSMVEGVIAVDRDELVLHMNAVAGDILGVDPNEVLGKRIWETVRVNEIAKSLGSSLAGQRVYRTQSRIMRADEECLLDIRASSLTDGDGVVTGAVVLFHDVTEMRRLELVRREFVDNASHELKTPITAIRGFLDTLVDDADMPREIREKFLRRASSQADRLALLVTDLLRLSRFEAGGSSESAERIDLRDVVRKSVAELQLVAADKAIKLTACLGDEAIVVIADRATVELVTDNLVDNAIKYTGDGGRIEVRTTLRDGEAFLEVEDNGVGIDAEHQDRIFERFYRVDKARSREVGGTGLGLAIAKHACGVLGGDLSVKSEPGVGSTFLVRLPGE